METLARLAGGMIVATPFQVIDLTDSKNETEGIRWWEELTGRGGEGMVVKPFEFIAKGRRGLVQPAVKCRGREYLRIIYGPEYTAAENLERLGSGRLVATRAAPNIPFKFDGFEAIYDRPYWHATAFVTRPVIEYTDRFDSEDDGTGFWGLYLTRWFDDSRKSGVDLYYLGISREHGQYASGTENELRHSFGTRWFGERNQWDWNGEAVAQVGDFGNESILAWTASLDAGYTWDASWKPRLGLKADIASGDNNPTNGTQGTFDALYFKSGYFNDASLIRPENIIDVHPNLSANLTQALSIDGGADVFWRDSRNDAVYAVPGFVAIPALKTASAFVGTGLDVNLEWRVQRHLSFLASYVHFFSGDYIRAAGGRDVNYVSTTMSFLF